MTVIEKKAISQGNSVGQKYGGYILPFDHFGNLTVYSRIWKNLPQDRYDFICGRLALQSESLLQKMNNAACSDILAGVNFDHKKNRKVGTYCSDLIKFYSTFGGFHVSS